MEINKAVLKEKNIYIPFILYITLIIVLVIVGIVNYNHTAAGKSFDWNPILIIAGIFAVFFPPIQMLLSIIKRTDKYWDGISDELKELMPQESQLRKLSLSGVSVMDFTDSFIEFVVTRSIDFRGKLYFYNIPLQTFESTDDFLNLWGVILKNDQIKSINFLIDEKYQNDLSNCFNYTDKQKRKIVDYAEKNKLDYDKIKFIVKKLRDPDNSLSRVNFGLWSEGNNLVTMTGHFTPFGHPSNERALHRFIAFDKNENEILQRVKESVIHLFSSKDGILMETSLSSILN